MSAPSTCAQLTGNPLITQTHHELAVSVSGSLARKQISRVTSDSKHYFVCGLGSLITYATARGRFVQRLETAIDKLVLSDGGVSQHRRTGEYLSGFEAGAIVGSEFDLPSRLNLSFETAARNSSDFAFSIGLSQTGKP
ncbi:MAG: hypothetical protein ACE5HO_05460 [bacterium]